MLAAGLTAAMMVGEIAGGYGFNSMALLADGWHMGSHALALGLGPWLAAEVPSLVAAGAIRPAEGGGGGGGR